MLRLSSVKSKLILNVLRLPLYTLVAVFVFEYTEGESPNKVDLKQSICISFF